MGQSVSGREGGFGPSRHFAEHGFGPRRRFAEHGFTLIETLVALAVFSIAALALLRLEGATASAAARVGERQIGQIVARNIAYTALTDPVPPSLGTSNGEEESGGRAWTWTRTVAAISDGALLRVDVRVASPEGGPAGALTVLRSAR